MDPEALIIRNLSKRFNSRSVLEKVNLRIAVGDCLALVGPSGSGKTTLLRLIAGFDHGDSGSIEIRGRIVSDPVAIVPPRARSVGMVFQDLALWPHMTALQNVEFMIPRAVHGKSRRNAKACDLLKLVQMGNRENDFPYQLSRGQQQRVALARALAGEPDLLLLDEPFSSQDNNLKWELIETFRKLRGDNKFTTLYATHSPTEIRQLQSRVAELRDGVVLEPALRDGTDTTLSEVHNA